MDNNLHKNLFENKQNTKLKPKKHKISKEVKTMFLN